MPKPPEGLTLEDVRPLVGDANAEVAACAGYLMALLGDPAGMEPLVQYWRQHGETRASGKNWSIGRLPSATIRSIFPCCGKSTASSNSMK